MALNANTLDRLTLLWSTHLKKATLTLYEMKAHEQSEKNTFCWARNISHIRITFSFLMQLQGKYLVSYQGHDVNLSWLKTLKI